MASRGQPGSEHRLCRAVGDLAPTDGGLSRQSVDRGRHGFGGGATVTHGVDVGLVDPETGEHRRVEGDAVVVVDGHADGQPGDLPEHRVELGARHGAAQTVEPGQQGGRGRGRGGQVRDHPEVGGDALEQYPALGGGTVDGVDGQLHASLLRFVRDGPGRLSVRLDDAGGDSRGGKGLPTRPAVASRHVDDHRSGAARAGRTPPPLAFGAGHEPARPGL